MKNRLLSLILFVLAGVLLFGADRSMAQGDRRGEPGGSTAVNFLSSGYYAVDSYDDAPLPWRPNYFFMDTTYHPFEWHRVRSGPQQPTPPIEPFYYFHDPANASNPTAQDTVDNCIAGPIPIGFTFYYYNQPYDSLYISSNGYIGFMPRSVVDVPGNSSPYAQPRYSDIKGNYANEPRAIVAALMGDLVMNPKFDTTKVYVRTSPFLDSFFISFYNFRLSQNTSVNVWLNSSQGGPGAGQIYITKMQVVLTRADSSIQINYGQFSGQVTILPSIPAWKLFQMNCGIGTVNETSPPTQFTSVLAGTHGFTANNPGRWDAGLNTNCKSCNRNLPQGGQYAVKLKQWRNIVRAVSVDFPPRNYEICLGATVFPIATFKNVDNNPQTFKVKFQIRNIITGLATYGRTFVLTNVAPQGTVTTQSGNFTQYATNPNIINQLGAFYAYAIATAFDANDNFIGDRWPFDDTVKQKVFGLRTQNIPYNDPTDSYSHTQYFDMPDQTKWVSIGPTVEEGEVTTFDPPAPRYESGNGVGPSQLLDPVVHLDVYDQNGNYYAGSGYGDSLVSFPFNMAGQTKGSLTFDYQRAGRNNWPLNWDANSLIGPERCILNPNGSVARAGDSLVVEFKLPTEPACNPSLSGWRQVGSIDGGNDFEFRHFNVRLDAFTKPNFSYFNNTFRFRIRLKAKYDGNPTGVPDDDGEDWYIDNIALQVPRKPEIEVMWVRIVTPYTHLPMSQAVSLPVYVRLANNSSDVAVAFPLRVQILDPNQNTVYWALQTVTSLAAGQDTTIIMPNWNALYAGQGGYFRAHAFLATNGYDSYTADNGVFTDFFLDPGVPGAPQEFAWDDGSNDIPNLTLVQSTGIGFSGVDGSVAIKFQIVTKDTLYGIRSYFAAANQADDQIRLTILKGKTGSCVPSADTIFKAQMEDKRKGNLFDQYWPYYFPEPIILNPGIYWASVSQLAVVTAMFGADISRGGGRLRVADPLSPVIFPMYNDPMGTNIGPDQNTGDVSCAFAQERIAGSGNWGSLTPGNGAWASTNTSPYFNKNGTFYPMIRAMVSKSTLLPIELVYLHGKNDNGKSLLTWATAQEQNNRGFFIERRNADQADGFFSKIDFVEGKGTTNTQTGYSYVDRNIVPGTYTYRLVQMDLDGTEHTSNTVNVTVDAPANFALEQNFPNPFNPSTEITFTLPESAPTKLVVYNSLGQVVRTLVDGNVDAGTHKVTFDAKDDGGNELSSGTYIYKIISGSFNETRKMTLAK